MRPVLFSVFGLDVNSYGLSKAMAALVAAWLLGRSFSRRGMAREHAHALVLAGALWGFVGAKAYYVAENARHFDWHLLGGSGFTWYGGFLTGAAAVVVAARRRGLPLMLVLGLSTAPLAVAYGIGRIGCLLAGDGTYGKPSALPWALGFPNGTVPTSVPVQPTPLYEALAAFALAGLLLLLQSRVRPATLVVVYLAAAGLTRLLVEFARINRAVAWGLTQPQLWSIAMVLGALILAVAGRPRRMTRSALNQGLKPS